MKKILFLILAIMFSSIPQAFAQGETYSVEGYYVRESNTVFSQQLTHGFFILTKADQELKDFLQEQIDQGNTVNDKTRNGTFKFNLGCDKGNSVENQSFSINRIGYKYLRTSHKTNPIEAEITIEETGIDGSCISFATDFEMPDMPNQDIPGSFSDVTTVHPNFKAIEYLENKGIIHGHPDGTFKPDVVINRAELTKIVVEHMAGNPGTNYKNCFPDVTTQWFAPYVCYAKEKGWIHGYPDGKFRPANQTNRAEAIKIIINTIFEGNIPSLQNSETAAIHYPEHDPNAWYFSYLKYALAKNLLDFQHVIYPNYDHETFKYFLGSGMTRKEAAELMYRTLITPVIN